VAPADSSDTAGSVPAELTSACADVTDAGEADAIGGRQARYCAAPASTAEAAAVLRAAGGLGLTVVPRGSGSRLDWAASPASCDLIIDTRRMDQVVEHAAGDLVVTVQAGVRVDELAKVLAMAGQRLALDPPASAADGSAVSTSGTVGGLIATGAAGPLRYRYGSPRDLLIGITFVRADGTVAKSGGKVVKNVAGYDIGKLLAGSFGTLGLITQATFRLHPLPAAAAWVTANCRDPAGAAATVRAIADSPLAPSAIELDWPGAGAPLTVAALLEGDEDSVAGRTARMRQLLERADDGATHAEPREDRELPGTILRLAFWAGDLTAVLTAIRGAAEATALDPAIGGSAGSGVLEVSVPAEAAVEAVADFLGLVRAGLEALGDGLPPSRASAVVLSAPPVVRDAVDVWGPAPSLALMRAVKDQFDPGHRMAPGRFAGGI
jgi:glycolate oxidase FAD binding subunit